MTIVVDVDPRAGAPVEIKFSDPQIVNLTVYRGDSGRIRVTVTSAVDGSPYDVSGATWDCDIRVSATSESPLTSMTVTPVAGHTNQVDVILTSAQSQLLTTSGVWDLEMRLNGEVRTVIRGTVTVISDVSRP